LFIEWSGNYGTPVYMTGPATYVCDGVFSSDFADALTPFDAEVSHA
jgi:hypothetical protein